MRYAAFLLFLAACAREAKTPDPKASCIGTDWQDGVATAKLCEYKGYMWQCDRTGCIRTKPLAEPEAECAAP